MNRYCADCRHVVGSPSDNPTAARCRLGQINLVSGRPDEAFCIQMRDPAGRCGPDGLLFDKRPTLVPPAAKPDVYGDGIAEKLEAAHRLRLLISQGY